MFSIEERKKKTEGKERLKRSAEKNLQRVLEKYRLLERARKKERTNDIKVSNRKNLTRF